MATSFLDGQMQNTYQGASQGGALGGQFANVLNSMQGTIQQNAQVGVLPGQTGNLSPQQVAAQMSTGGVTSVLPYLGGSFMPKLIFPVAGVWSLVDGVRAYGQFKSDLNNHQEEHFNPNQLQYENKLNELMEAQNHWGHLGPMRMDR